MKKFLWSENIYSDIWNTSKSSCKTLMCDSRLCVGTVAAPPLLLRRSRRWENPLRSPGRATSVFLYSYHPPLQSLAGVLVKTVVTVVLSQCTLCHITTGIHAVCPDKFQFTTLSPGNVVGWCCRWITCWVCWNSPCCSHPKSNTYFPGPHGCNVRMGWQSAVRLSECTYEVVIILVCKLWWIYKK